jgi:hypothetical protein
MQRSGGDAETERATKKGAEKAEGEGVARRERRERPPLADFKFQPCRLHTGHLK